MATFLETYAGLVPGHAILGHCRTRHTPDAYLATLAEPNSQVWIAEIPPGAAPVGYAMLASPDFPDGITQEGDLELRRIYLLSRFHGAGIGKRLMEMAVAAARDRQASRLLLGVHPDNQRALAFYTSRGFRQVGERHFHVGGAVFTDPVLALPLP